MKTGILLTIVMAVSIHSAAQLSNYGSAGSVKIIGAKTKLVIEPVDVELKPDEHGVTLVTAIGTIAPALISLGVKAVQQKLEKDALAYTGVYSAFNSAQGFYNVENYVGLPKLTVQRWIIDATGEDRLAAELVFDPEISEDRTAFRYKFNNNESSYHYTIAKLKKKHRHIDVTVEIKVKSLTVTKDQYKSTDLGTALFTIPLVKLGETYSHVDEIYSGWMQLPLMNTFTKKVSTMQDTVSKITRTMDIITIEPPKAIEETVITVRYGADSTITQYEKSGVYEVSATVTETNPYKIKAEQRAARAEATGEAATDFLKAILEVLTPKPKED